MLNLATSAQSHVKIILATIEHETALVPTMNRINAEVCQEGPVTVVQAKRQIL